MFLFVSNFIVRGIGFLYKIFLSNAIGETGLGIYNMIFNFLLICIAITTTGIPTLCLYFYINHHKELSFQIIP